MALGPTRLLGALLITTAIVAVVLVWLALEVRSLHGSIGPLASSPIARGIAGLGAST